MSASSVSTRLYRVNDSKQLTERRREELFDRIAEWCEDWSVGHASPAECDELGMSDAQRLATRRALGGLQHPPDAYLVDGKWNFVPADVVGDAPLQMMVKGDARSLSIAAASIIMLMILILILNGVAIFIRNKFQRSW